MSIRGHWLAIVIVALGFVLAASADTLARRRAAAPARPTAPTAASRPRASTREVAEVTTRSAALRVVGAIAATGRVPDGVPIAAAMPSTTESVTDGIVSVARLPVAPEAHGEPSCFCRATNARGPRAWTCSATVMRDVHHMLVLTFAVDERGPRLERIQSMIGGW